MEKRFLHTAIEKLHLNDIRVSLCYVFFFLTRLDRIIQLSNLSVIRGMLPHYGDYCNLLLLLGVLLVLSYRPSFKQLAVIGVVLFPYAVYTYYYHLSSHMIILPHLLVILVAARLDVKKLVRMELWMTVMLVVSCALLSHIGFIESGSLTTAQTRGIEEELSTMRHSFGLGHPNVAGLFFALIGIYLMLCYWNEMKWYHWGVVAADMAFISEVIDSRGALLLLAAVVLMKVFVDFVPNIFEFRLIRLLTLLLPVTLFVFSWLMGRLYLRESGIAMVASKLTTGRVRLIARTMENYSVQLFGQRLDSKVVGWLDNGYMGTLYKAGLLFTIVYLVGVTVLLYRLLKRGCTAEVVVEIAFLVYHLMENRMVESFNPFLLLIGSVILCQPIAEQPYIVPHVEKQGRAAPVLPWKR